MDLGESEIITPIFSYSAPLKESFESNKEKYSSSDATKTTMGNLAIC